MYWSLVCGLFASPGLYAQVDANNPFELVQRVKQHSRPDTPATASTNPFDINRQGAVPRRANDPITTEVIAKTWTVGGFTFWLVVGMTVFLALVLPWGRSAVQAFTRVLEGAGPFHIVYRNHSRSATPLSIALNVFYYFSLGFFIYLAAIRMSWLGDSDLGHFLLIVLGVSAFSIGKMASLIALGRIFQLRKDIKKITFLVAIFNSLLGLTLFPLDLLLAYGPGGIQQWALGLGVLIIGVAFIYRIFIGVGSTSQRILRNKFNFFMYLCTLEAVPALVILKWLWRLSAGMD